MDPGTIGTTRAAAVALSGSMGRRTRVELPDVPVGRLAPGEGLPGFCDSGGGDCGTVSKAEFGGNT
ncbi:MAG: hypothetical protein ACK49E_05445, partial [Planctomyces sp.]